MGWVGWGAGKEGTCYKCKELLRGCEVKRYLFDFLYRRIRKAGYPIRHTFKEFIDRYYMLSEGLARDALDFQGLKNAAITIAKRLIGNTDWQIGKTKIFLKVSY